MITRIFAAVNLRTSFVGLHLEWANVNVNLSLKNWLELIQTKLNQGSKSFWILWKMYMFIHVNITIINFPFAKTAQAAGVVKVTCFSLTLSRLAEFKKWNSQWTFLKQACLNVLGNVGLKPTNLSSTFVSFSSPTSEKENLHVFSMIYNYRVTGCTQTSRGSSNNFSGGCLV